MSIPVRNWLVKLVKQNLVKVVKQNLFLDHMCEIQVTRDIEKLPTISGNNLIGRFINIQYTSACTIYARSVKMI